MHADLQAIGKRIHQRRRSMGYTQEQLAERMNVSIQMISNLERGIKAIRIDNLITLCGILEVSTDYILTGEQAPGELGPAAQLARLPGKSRRMIEMLVEYCLEEGL